MARRTTTDYVPVEQRRAAKRRTRRDGNLTAIKWWLAEDDDGTEAQSRLWTWIERLRGQWSVDGMADLIHEAIYADKPLARGSQFDGRSWSSPRDAGGLCILNAIKSLVDTASARLTKVRSMPAISADDAPYSEKRFARESSRILRRKMGAQDFEQCAPLLVRDFCIRGTAVAKVHRKVHGGDTGTKRIPIYEVIYDHRESQFMWPTSMAHVRPESRERLLAAYPDYAEEIAKAPIYSRLDPWMQYVYQGPTLADLVEVAECWHPPSCEDAADGQHIIAIRGTTILREPWTCPIPLVFAWWTAPIREGDVRGCGLVEEHANAQDIINGVLNDARKAIRLASQLKIFAPRAANVNKNHLRARDPAVLEIDGPPGQIQFVAPDPVSKQAWAIAFQIKSEMYNISGIPEWQAAGKKPLGNNVSGKAIDTMDDMASDRFAQVETGWQQARVGIGRAHIDLAKHIHAEMKGKLKRRFPEQPKPIAKADVAEWIRGHEWDRVDIDGGDYHLTLEPINFISGTRGGKLEEIAEAAKAGLIPDPTMTAALMDEPDIQRMNRATLGPYHRIERCLEGLANPKVDYMTIAPDDYMNLPLAKLMAKGEHEQAVADEADDETIERFERFLADIKAKEDAAAASGMGSPSLQGAQSNTTIAQGNAATLQPGGGGPPALPPGMPPTGPGPAMPPGMTS